MASQDLGSLVKLHRLLDELPATVIVLVVSGGYLWDFLTSLNFEYSFLKRRKLFTWPMVPYFAGRYLALCVVCLAIYLTLPVPGGFPGVTIEEVVEAMEDGSFPVLDLSSASWISEFLEQLFGNITNALATLSLGIRAMAIWGFKRKIVVALVLCFVGQWVAIIIENVLTNSQLSLFDDRPFVRMQIVLLTPLAYTTALDIVIFILTACRIQRLRSDGTHTRLLDRMLKDGFFYFLLAVSVNVVMLYIQIASANGGAGAILVDLGNFPSAILSSMISNRLVRRVANFSTTMPAVYLVTEDTFVFQPVATRNCDLGAEEP